MSGYVRFRDGAWRIRVEAGVDPITRRRRQVHGTVHAPNNKAGRRRAEARKAELMVEVAAGRSAPKTGMTVDQLLERYIAHRSGDWSPGSAHATRARIRQHISPHIGARTIDTIRPIDIVDLHTRWRATGMVDSTAGRLHDILRAALRQAVRWEILPRNPASSDHVDRPTSKAPLVKLPSARLLAKGLAVAGDDLRLYLRLSALTGARRGEMVALRRSTLNLDKREILFATAFVKIPGGVVEKEPKEGVEHKASIDPHTVDLVHLLYKRQAERALAAGVPLARDPFLFARDEASAVAWHPDGATQRWAAARSKVKGLERTRLHDLRHWMATTLMEEDGDAIQTAGRGGWADPHEVHKRYGQHRPAKDEAAALTLARILDA